MYNENNSIYDDTNDKKLSIKWMVLAVLMLLLIIFVLIWVFTPKEEEVANTNWFSDNTLQMQKVAKNYFTEDKLPKEEGKAVKMTLNEMVNLKLIVPVKDSNNNACDVNNSYIEIAKTSKEYVVKTSLVCPEKANNNIVEHVGCYSLNAKECSVLKTTMYQLQRKWYKGYIANTTGATIQYKHVKYGEQKVFAKNSYVCATGYILDGTKCSKSVTSKKYYCKDTTSTLTTDNKCKIAKNVYACPTGSGSLDAKTHKCKVTQAITYSCPSGGTIVSPTDHRCKKAKPATYVCPDGYSNYDKTTKKCSKVIPASYTCSAKGDTIVSGSKPVKCKHTSYVCNTGDTPLANNKCKHTVYSYVCASGQVMSTDKTKCYKANWVLSGSTGCYTGAKGCPPVNDTLNKYTLSSSSTSGGKTFNSYAHYYNTDHTYVGAPSTKKELSSSTYTANKPSYTTYNAVTTPQQTKYVLAVSKTTYEYYNAKATTIKIGTLVNAKLTTTYSYVAATLGSVTSKQTVDPISTTPVYENRITIVDTKWTFNAKEVGYSMTAKRDVAGNTIKVYTPDWVLTLPKGYIQTEVKTEEKWSVKNSEDGWTYTGKTKQSNN